MTMFVAFILLANVIVSSSFLFQCATSKRLPPHRPTQTSSKSAKSSKSKSRKSSRSSRSKSTKSGSKSGRSSSKSGKSKSSRRSKKSKRSRKSQKKNANRKVHAAILADQRATQDATKQMMLPQAPQQVDNPAAPNKISYANIRVIPHEVGFPPVGGLKSVRVKNSTGKRTAFMVKCSDNMLFSINPVYGIIEPDRDAQINILRENRDPKHDKLVIITATQPENRRTAEETFAEIYNTNSHNYNISVVPLLAQ